MLKQADAADLRFAESIDKQRNFTAIALGGLSISSAQILRQDSRDGHLNIVMRYITGMNGEDFALQGDRPIAVEISCALSALLLDNMARSEIRDVASQLFLDKITQVVAATHWPELVPVMAQTFACVHDLIGSRPSIAVPLGPCHGDLTLSNVIWSPSLGLVLIDFLSTYLESPLQDLAKISQELEFGWSFRRMDQNLRIKSQLFSQLAFPSYGRYLYALFPGAAYLFKLLCLARIAPYITDPVSAAWLVQSLHTALAQAPEAKTLCPPSYR
ncbi:MAG: phosphotransferase [Rhodoferax sp.]|nr:phosphotransferase [Rhodoferax sp.]